MAVLGDGAIVVGDTDEVVGGAALDGGGEVVVVGGDAVLGGGTVVVGGSVEVVGGGVVAVGGGSGVGSGVGSGAGGSIIVTVPRLIEEGTYDFTLHHSSLTWTLASITSPTILYWPRGMLSGKERSMVCDSWTDWPFCVGNEPIDTTYPVFRTTL